MNSDTEALVWIIIGIVVGAGIGLTVLYAVIRAAIVSGMTTVIDRCTVTVVSADTPHAEKPGQDPIG